MIKKPAGNPSWLNRRTVTLVVLALIVVAGVYLNSILETAPDSADGYQAAGAGLRPTAALTPGKTPASSPASLPKLTGSAIEDLRSERERVRAQELAILDGMIADAKTSAEGKRDAETQKMLLTSFMDQEATAESLLRAKGYARVAVTVSAGTVNVVVGADSLTEKDVARILEIAAKETKQPATNITVMTSK